MMWAENFKSLVCVRVKGGESEWFRIDGGVRHGCIMSPCLFNVYVDAVMEEVKMRMGRRGVRVKEEGREWKMPGLLYVNDLEEDLRAMVGNFEVCRRLGMKVNAGKGKVIMFGGSRD